MLAERLQPSSILDCPELNAIDMLATPTPPSASGVGPPVRIHRIDDPQTAEKRLNAIAARTRSDNHRRAEATVAEILRDVESRGDAAVLDYAEKFDRCRPDPLRLPSSATLEAWEACDSGLRGALELAHRRITDFHHRQKPTDLSVSGVHGEKLGRRWRPVCSAGLYIPGGRASYPSTVLMNAVPARVAGVQRIALVTPPAADGAVDSTVLAAAHLCGVTEVYRMGGAQAIAALAHGTDSIDRVDVISGPGNLWVTLAKKVVYGLVGIDSLAGPSEVLIIADQDADPEQVAIDLLAQAEHDPLAAAILLTTSTSLADAVPRAIERQLEGHPRAELCLESLNRWGLIVHCASLEMAAHLSDRFAPEHLELLVERPTQLADHIRHAGAIFLGPWSPEAVGDYLAGPNHTLPTSGTARFSGALSVETFMSHTSLIGFNQAALEATGAAVIALAECEGLHSHAQSVRQRLS